MKPCLRLKRFLSTASFELGAHFNKHLKPRLSLSAMQTIWNLQTLRVPYGLYCNYENLV